jgi:plastocyanin
MRLALRLLFPSIIAGVTAIACASTSNAPSATSAAPAAKAAVTIKGFAFSPATLEITKGTTVTFTNNDGTTHTVTSGANRTKDGKFDKQLSGSTEDSITFDTAGTFEYFCNFHSSMKGTVVVK